MRRLALLALGLFLALPAFAQEVPPLPRERPDWRDDGVVERQGDPDEPPAADEAEEPEAPADEPVEPAEPPRIFQAACPALIAGRVEATMLPPIDEEGCGERSPLAVTAVLVNGRMVPLTAPATLNCGMATALADWAASVDGYLWSRENTRIAGIVAGTSYMCRPRNNAAGGDLSEHAFTNALDVTGFALEDGRTIGLPADWLPPDGPGGRLLRFAHDAGCALFTTTLGPEANALHADHLHLDMGCHGERCMARLCE